MASTTESKPSAVVSTIIEDLSAQLIHAELGELSARERLERAIREAAASGATIDSLSEQSGFTPADIKRIITAQREWFGMDLDALLGSR